MINRRAAGVKATPKGRRANYQYYTSLRAVNLLTPHPLVMGAVAMQASVAKVAETGVRAGYRARIEDVTLCARRVTLVGGFS